MGSFKAIAFIVIEKSAAYKTLTKKYKSEKGHNSVKIQIRVMGLGGRGHYNDPE